MRQRFFIIPAQNSEAAEDELNAFCAQHRIIAVDKHFVADGGNSFWSLCLTWTPGEAALVDAARGARTGGKNKTDYKEVLNEADFALYAQLRDLRKALSERDGVPVYALFTNEQLASMVQLGVSTQEAMLQLEGVGPARVEKYADAFLQLINAARSAKQHETGSH